jgi:hypothetical protein
MRVVLILSRGPLGTILSLSVGSVVGYKRRCWLGNNDGFKRTNFEEMERAIKEIIVKQELEVDALLRDEVDKKCKV